jgi:hypothetical protein
LNAAVPEMSAHQWAASSRRQTACVGKSPHCGSLGVAQFSEVSILRINTGKNLPIETKVFENP